MVYYLSTRSDSNSGNYAMSMDLNTLSTRRFETSYSALTWLISVPIVVFIAVFSLLALMQPGMCCTVDEKGVTVFSRGKAIGISFAFALISLGITAYFLSKLE
jgi:hypothetical protein